MKTPIITVIGSFAVGMTIRAPKLPIFGETHVWRRLTTWVLAEKAPTMGRGDREARRSSSSLLAMVGADKLASIRNRSLRRRRR